MLSFFRVWCYDLLLFWLINRREYLVWMILLSSFTLLSIQVEAGAESKTVYSGLLTIFGGFEPSSKKLSFLWLVPQVVLAYLSGKFVNHELAPPPLFSLIRFGSRTKWWISKIMTVTLYSFIYYISLFVCLFGVSLLYEFIMRGQIHVSAYLIIGLQEIHAGTFFILLLGIFITTSIIILLLQSLISLLIGSLLSFMVMLLLYLMAFYIPSGWLPTTNSNLKGYEIFYNGVLTFWFTYCFNIAGSVILILLTNRIVKSMDFIEKSSRK